MGIPLVLATGPSRAPGPHRVRRLEAELGDGDPEHVKVQWPTPEVCPSCRRSPSSFMGSRGASSSASRAPRLLQRAGIGRDRLRPAGAPEDLGASGTPTVVGEGAPLEDPIMTLSEAVVAEGWDLDEVHRFLDRFYLAQ